MKMNCSKCHRKIDATEANEYYFGKKLISSADLDMYPEGKIKAVCQRCL
jgi:hypothetical protein